MNDRRDLLFEIGTEEMPARFIEKAAADLTEAGRKALSEARFDFAGVRVYATPRRLALYVEGLAERQSDEERKVKGPAARAAFDQEGRPTRAAEGFARSQGVSAADLHRITDDAGDYVYAFVHEAGKGVDEVIPDLCSGLLRSLAFAKNMRWGSSDFRFVRPIRWLVLMRGDEALHMDFEGISSGNLSRGHRTLGPAGPVKISSAEGYLDSMRSAGVVADQDERREIIVSQVKGVADELGGQAVLVDELLREIMYLIEWPTAFAGSFDERFLALPETCVTTPMEGHQRYFPVKRDGALMNKFIAIRNGGSEAIDNVRRGNERVLSARLADAKFFFEDDMRHKLEDRKDKLAGIAFAAGLGSMKDKAERVTKLALLILASGDKEGRATEGQMRMAEVAGRLMKCDLATNMVREFTELQGEIGAIYARLEGQPEEVSVAIAEQYMPNAAGGELPKTRIGAALALADKADNLAGYFGLGQIPTGSADPYALRRNTQGMIAIHETMKPGIGIKGILTNAIQHIWPEGAPREEFEILKDLTTFAEGRLKGLLLDEGHRYDLVDAAMALGIDQPGDIRSSLAALEMSVGEPWMSELSTAFVRVRNIAKSAEGPGFILEAFKEDSEVNLAESFESVSEDIEDIMSEGKGAVSYATAMKRFAALKPAIDTFFEKVMIMCEDEYVRKNRLGLVKSIEELALKLADFSKISQ